VNTDRHPITVVAGIIEREGRFLLGRRRDGTHLAGYWEFPGGKVQPGESHAESLRREIHEELGCDSRIGELVLSTTFEYPGRSIELHFFSCAIDGEPRAELGQELRWVRREELSAMQLPPADDELVQKLQESAARNAR
jgi:mutator protein MutT